MKRMLATLSVVAALWLAGCASPQSISAVASSEIITPAADVSAAMRVYSGVWVGKWDGVWDAAIIVKKISPDGMIDGTYRWVDNIGQPYTTSTVTSGKIEDGVLTLGKVQLRVDPSDPTTAQGDLFHAANDAHRTSKFRKVM